MLSSALLQKNSMILEVKKLRTLRQPRRASIFKMKIKNRWILK